MGSMNQSKAEEIVARLLSYAAELQYGSVAVCVKLYNGQAAQVLYTITENTKESVSQTADEE